MSLVNPSSGLSLTATTAAAITIMWHKAFHAKLGRYTFWTDEDGEFVSWGVLVHTSSRDEPWKPVGNGRAPTFSAAKIAAVGSLANALKWKEQRSALVHDDRGIFWLRVWPSKEKAVAWEVCSSGEVIGEGKVKDLAAGQQAAELCLAQSLQGVVAHVEVADLAELRSLVQSSEVAS